jgi:hypothetical protein
MNKTEHEANNTENICNRKQPPLANYTVTENVPNDPEIKGALPHMSKIIIAD